jgi:hypothetical protein
MRTSRTRRFRWATRAGVALWACVSMAKSVKAEEFRRNRGKYAYPAWVVRREKSGRRYGMPYPAGVYFIRSNSWTIRDTNLLSG